MRSRRNGLRDAQDNGASPEQYDVPGRRPWFGPRRFGYGYAPQTWQGYLISAAAIVATVLLGTLTKRGSLHFLAAAPIIVLLVVIAVSRRRT